VVGWLLSQRNVAQGFELGLALLKLFELDLFDDSVLWPAVVSIVIILLLNKNARNSCLSGVSCELRERAL
jgi:hypothetical protein